MNYTPWTDLPCYLTCFSIGGESLCVVQNNYAVIWFKEKELNMVFGLQLSFARVVSNSQEKLKLYVCMVCCCAGRAVQ